MKNILLIVQFFLFELPYYQIFGQNCFQFSQNSEFVKNALSGVIISDLSTSKVIYELNSKKNLTPASVLKILTTATALEILGENFVFNTKVSFTGSIANGTLTGDIIIKGGGDPCLGSENFKTTYNNPVFQDVVNWLKQNGVKKVSGNVYADASLYPNPSIPGKWTWEDMGNYYGAIPNGLSIFDNQYTIFFKTGGKDNEVAILKKYEPEYLGLNFVNEVVASNTNSDNSIIYGSNFDNKRIITGTIPKNKENFKVKGSMPLPQLMAAKELFFCLKNNNIEVTGLPLIKKCDDEKYQDSCFINISSPQLSEIINEINKKSMNLYAEHLVYQLGITKKNSATRIDGLDVIKEFWKEKGLDLSTAALIDGSGLSPFNYITPQQLNDILVFMKKSVNYSSFYNSLAINGVSGTLTTFCDKEGCKGRISGKSGSFSNVRCYAGYIKTLKNKELSFVVMINNFTCESSSIKSLIEDYLAKIIKEY